MMSLQDESRKRKKIPLFERNGASVPFALTDRDLSILQCVHDHRFVTVDHVTTLTGIPYPTLTRRLQKLYHHGYLDRPKGQRDLWCPGRGGVKIAYGLGQRGADVLTQQLRLPIADVDWKEKNRDVGSFYITHTLGIITLRASLVPALRQDPRELTLSEWRHLDGLRVSVPLPTEDGAKESALIPDAFFILENAEYQYPLFLEWDESTMPVDRTSSALSSIKKKLLQYFFLWRVAQKDPASPLQQVFGIEPSYRVLFITSTTWRIATMIRLCQKLFPHARRLFWFTTSNHISLLDPAYLTAPVWYTGDTALHPSGKTIIGAPECLLPQRI